MMWKHLIANFFCLIALYKPVREGRAYISLELKEQGPNLRYLRRAIWRGRFFGIYGLIEPDLETRCEKIAIS